MRNKYKEALLTLRNGKPLTRDVRNECCDVLAKLVDKETPMKVVRLEGHNYCPNCGQHLDWSEVDD